MSDTAPPVSNKEGKKKKKEDKEFEYEKQADDEGTLEEEEKLDQADAKVNGAPLTCARSNSHAASDSQWHQWPRALCLRPC